MRKLTKVGVALVLGLLVSLSMFTTGAFAQSANQSLASCGWNSHQGSGGSYQDGNWGGNGGLSGCQRGGCEFSSCNNNGGDVQCATVLKTFTTSQVRREVQTQQILVTRREVQTIRSLRVYRQMVNVYNGWQVRHVMRVFRSWQVQHVVRVFKTLQTRQVVRMIRTQLVSHRAVRVCHQF